jgi:hypothetical protein
MQLAMVKIFLWLINQQWQYLPVTGPAGVRIGMPLGTLISPAVHNYWTSVPSCALAMHAVLNYLRTLQLPVDINPNEKTIPIALGSNVSGRTIHVSILAD